MTETERFSSILSHHHQSDIGSTTYHSFRRADVCIYISVVGACVMNIQRGRTRRSGNNHGVYRRKSAASIHGDSARIENQGFSTH